MKRGARSVLIALAVLVGSLVELRLFVSDARAIIGRPLTPMSYAGVARRTTRRAAVVGASVAYPAAPPVVYAPPPVAYPVPARYW